MKTTYYGREIDISGLPGWRGRLVRFYVRLASWLQRRIEWHLFHLVAKEQGLSEQAVSELEEVFKDENVEAARRVVSSLLNPNGVPPPSRADRYREEGSTHALASFAAYLAPRRSKRYARRRDAKLADRDGDMLEAVPAARWRPSDE